MKDDMTSYTVWAKLWYFLHGHADVTPLAIRRQAWEQVGRFSAELERLEAEAQLSHLGHEPPEPPRRRQTDVGYQPLRRRKTDTHVN